MLRERTQLTVGASKGRFNAYTAMHKAVFALFKQSRQLMPRHIIYYKPMLRTLT
jgi:hypothetical protein